MNLPGEHHEKLVQLGEKASREVFLSGRRLHQSYGFTAVNQDGREVSVSSGDGAWIMRKCARLLGGDVSITFNPERTIFNLSVPALTLLDSDSEKDPNHSEWELPPDTWGIVVEDSKVQRKLLERLLALIGIEEDRRVVLGATADEVLHFNDTVRDLVESHKEDRFFIIADENLDIIENSIHRTLSGSLCIEHLRHELHPSDEARILAVVRSANDSSTDLDVYGKRTHGFLRKEPIRKENLSDVIQPLWDSRFKEDSPASPLSRRRSSMRSTESTSSGATKDKGRDSSATTTADLTPIVEAIDGLLAAKKDWPAIRDKFQVLKGDMMTLINRGNPRVVAVVETLEELRSAEECPADLEGRWKLMRALIMSMV